MIDKEVSNIIETQYERAKQILRVNKEKLDELAEKLIEKEVIFREDLEAIFGERPFGETDTIIEKTKEERKKEEEESKEDSQSREEKIAE